jgi:hypothetical protein
LGKAGVTPAFLFRRLRPKVGDAARRVNSGSRQKMWLRRGSGSKNTQGAGPHFPILLTPYRDTARRGIIQG